MLEATILRQWVDRLGLPFRDGADGDLQAELSGIEPKLSIRLTRQWLRLSLVSLPSGATTGPLKLRFLQHNANLRLVKFALDEQENIIICAELPTESLDFSELQNATVGIAAAHQWRESQTA